MKYEAPKLNELAESLLLAQGASTVDNETPGPGDNGSDQNTGEFDENAI